MNNYRMIINISIICTIERHKKKNNVPLHKLLTYSKCLTKLFCSLELARWYLKLNDTCLKFRVTDERNKDDCVDIMPNIHLWYPNIT